MGRLRLSAYPHIKSLSRTLQSATGYVGGRPLLQSWTIKSGPLVRLGNFIVVANPVPGNLVFREWFVRHAATTDIDAPRYGEQRSLGEHTVVSTL